MPKMTAPSRIVLVCLLSLIGFWPVAIISPRLIMFDFINAIGLSFGLAVLWRYGPAAWQAIRCALRKQLSRGHLLVLGIETTWIAMVSRTLILWHWRWVGEIAVGLTGWIPRSPLGSSSRVAYSTSWPPHYQTHNLTTTLFPQLRDAF
jgi:hypothetical protein